MDGYRSPYASNKELHEECRRHQIHRSRDNVCRKNCTTENARDKHDESTASEGADVANSGASDQRAELTNDGDDCGICGIFANLVLEEGRVEVLGLNQVSILLAINGY